MRGREGATSGRPATDAELISRYRDDRDEDVFDELGERHVEAARRFAGQLTCNDEAAENLLAEAFEVARAELVRGDGPDLAFRPYVLALVRDVAGAWASDGKRLLLADGYDALASSRDAVDENSLAARAFARMPERWRVALWHTAVEGESPAGIAPLLGLSPAAVNTLVQRARDGLRRVYLQADLDDDVPRECHETRDLLAEEARGRLSRKDRAALDEHIDACGRCRAVARDVEEIDASLTELVGGAVLGAFAPAYALPPDPSAAERGAAAPRRRVAPLAAVFAGVGIVVVAASAFAVINMSGSDGTDSAAARATPGASSTAPSTQPSTGPSDWTARPSHRAHHHSATPSPSASTPGRSTAPASNTSSPQHHSRSHGSATHHPSGRLTSHPDPTGGRPSKSKKPDPTPSKSHGHSSSPSPSPTKTCNPWNPACWFD